jgi:peptidyl-prolyl cis-trans isomerase C
MSGLAIQNAAKTLKPTDEALQKAYDERFANENRTEYKARHILVEEESTAIDLIGQLDEGADFQELASEHSTGPSGPNGGELPWFSPGDMVAPFSAAVIAMEDGTHSSAPVQTQFGWHVILREGSRDMEPPTLESVRGGIKQQIEQQRLQDYLQSLRSQIEG